MHSQGKDIYKECSELVVISHVPLQLLNTHLTSAKEAVVSTIPVFHSGETGNHCIVLIKQFSLQLSQSHAVSMNLKLLLFDSTFPFQHFTLPACIFTCEALATVYRPGHVSAFAK